MSANLKGPWVAGQIGTGWNERSEVYFGPDASPGHGFATVHGASHAEYARFIAAAPDMLTALKGVVRVADRATDEFDAARAAIAKAEGKS